MLWEGVFLIDELGRFVAEDLPDFYSESQRWLDKVRKELGV